MEWHPVPEAPHTPPVNNKTPIPVGRLKDARAFQKATVEASGVLGNATLDNMLPYLPNPIWVAGHTCLNI